MKLRFITLVFTALLFKLPATLHAGLTQHRVTLRNATVPVIVEIGERPGFIRVLGGEAGPSQTVLFDGRAQSIAIPRTNGANQEASKALTDAGYYLFDVDTKSPKHQDLLVVVSNASIFAYQGGGDANFVVAPIPVDQSVDVKLMRVSQLWIDWQTPNTVAFSFEYRVNEPVNDWEGIKQAAYIYQLEVNSGQSEHRQISSDYIPDIFVKRANGIITINYRQPGANVYQSVRIEEPAPVAKEIEFKAGSEPTQRVSTSRALVLVPPTAPPVSIAPSTEPRVGPEFKEYLSNFSRSLNELVLGQPEAVDLLLDIEKENILNNEARTVPEVGMFIGLPGSGKDTLVEAYVQTRMVQSLHDFSGSLDTHLYRIPVVKDKGDVWAVTGSATGYVGSGKLSALNRFLVLHSGGRYEIKKTEGNTPEEYIVENQSWKPGQVRAGYYAPQDGVLFVNEYHDWSHELKNTLLKEAFEKGYFTVGNPGPGVNRIQVPVTILIASNDGIGLITARDREGRRVGAPLTEEQMQERWKIFAHDKVALKKEISQAGPGNDSGGTSEEVLDRIPNSRLLLLRPLTHSIILKITKMKLEQLRANFASGKSKDFPAAHLEFSPKLERFLAVYDQLAEEGARPLNDKVKSLLKKTLSDAVFSGRLEYQNGDTLKLSVRKNADGTYSLMVGKKAFLIKATEKSRDAQAISDARIDELIKLEDELNKRVKGVRHIVAPLARDIRRAANTEKTDHPDKETKPADVYAFFGTSSTGKTELAVAVHQVLFKTDSMPIVIDFSQIQTVDDLKEKILGFRDSKNKSVASDFMSAYDRSNGRLVLVLDEISNANPKVLQALYDILRVPVVRTFSDSKSRPMGQVVVIMTGNAGEEWYSTIPRTVPEAEQHEAARKIYDKAVGDEGYIRRFLMSRFTEAFLNRVGTHRVFFFGPHTARTTRELIQFKLIKAVREFSESRAGRRSWKTKFASAEDYRKTIEATEDYGFKLWEQGASITNFVNQSLIGALHDRLLIEKIPNGSEVIITKTADRKLADGTSVGFNLKVVRTGQSFDVEVRGKATVSKMKKNANEIVWTAFHEAGHEIVTKVLLGDRMESRGLSILSGVTQIDGEWIMYEGIATREQIESLVLTPEVVIAKMAVLLGGEAGELLSTKGERHSAGKANDIQRATALANTAVLNWGLSQKWGLVAPGVEGVSSFISNLSNARRRILEKEVISMLDQARALARSVLIANYETLFNPIASHLAEKGEISGKALERFYQQRKLLVLHPDQTDEVAKKIAEFEAKIKIESPPTNLRDFEFYSFAKQPKTVADPEAVRSVKRAKELAEVDLTPGFKLVATNEPLPASAKVSRAAAPVKMAVANGGSCELLFF